MIAALHIWLGGLIVFALLRMADGTVPDWGDVVAALAWPVTLPWYAWCEIQERRA